MVVMIFVEGLSEAVDIVFRKHKITNAFISASQGQILYFRSGGYSVY